MNKLVFLLLAVLTLASCRKTFHKSQPIKVERPSIKVNEIEFEYFQSKAKIDFDDGTNEFSSPMTIRIRKDSVIWISVNPALGIEVVRALITPDSVFVIDKIHKAYYALGLNYIKNNFGVDMTFKMLQSALLGNLILPNSPQDSTEFEGDYAKLRQSRPDMDILNFIGKTSNKIESAVVTDRKTKNNLTIKYTDIAPLDDFQFGYTTQVIANYMTDKGMMKSNININHQRVDLKDKQMRFPFNVKNKYDRK